EVRAFLAETLGTHRYLVEYLGEEVFSHQPEAVQSFLLHTCILPRFSAPLCAAVSGESLEESSARLSSLEQANLFLVPLDAGGEWYRFHPLWASVLRLLLMRTLGAASVAALYGRASRWFEQLPRELWTVRPIVCLYYAWALFLSGASDAYVAPLEEADRLFRGAQSRIGMGMVEVLRALAALLWMDDREALRASQQAVALLPASDLRLRSLSTSILGGSHFLMGEMELAWQQLVEARRLHEQSGSLPALLVNMNLQANVLAAQGRLHEAAERYQQVIEASAERRDNAIDASIRQAGILYEWNAFERAEADLAGAQGGRGGQWAVQAGGDPGPAAAAPPFPRAGPGRPGALLAGARSGGG